jgi:hypothetical protein
VEEDESLRKIACSVVDGITKCVALFLAVRFSQSFYPRFKNVNFDAWEFLKQLFSKAARNFVRFEGSGYLVDSVSAHL